MLKEPDFSKYYSSFAGGFLFRWIDTAKIKILKNEFKNLDEDALILDLGCGAGNLPINLKTTCKNILCIDIDKNLLKLCKKEGLKTIRLDIEKRLPFDNCSVDGVILSDVLEHISHVNELICEIKRILKPKRKMIIFTPPYDSIRWLLAERFHHLLTKINSGHVSPFTKESLNLILKKYFSDIKIKRLNFNLTLCAVATKN